MAVTADKVVVELELRDGQYLARVRQNERVFVDAQKRTADSAERAERRIRASSDRISSALKGAASTIAAGVSVAAVTRMADSYTRLQNSLRVVGLEGAKAAQVQEQLYDIANRNGVAVEDLAQLYSRVALNNQALGASQAELATVTEAAAAALRVQGLSANEARGPLLQLAQTLGSDIARAEEYNSVVEGIPSLAQAVARGMGVTTAQLGALVREGKVTTQEYFQALLKGSADLIAQAEKAEKTIGQAFTRLNNELGRYVGQTDDSLSATQRFSDGIIGLANNLDRIIPAIATIAGLFGARYVAGLAAASIAQDGLIARGRASVAATLEDERIKTAAVAAGTRARTASYTAESIALRAQVDTGRNAAGQFVSRARSAEALTVANRNLAASIAPATVATVRNTAAVSGAVAGARALGTGLSALAGGPIGVAILAVAALSAAIVFLGDKTRIQGVVTRDAATAQTALKAATDAYAEAANAAAIASGRDAVAKRAAAEEARRQAIAERDNAKAKLASAQATIALIQAEAARMNNAERFNIRGDRPGSVQTIGRDQNQILANAQASATALAETIAAANTAINNANAAISARAPASAPDAPIASGQGRAAASGPTAAELEAMREEIRLSDQLALAQSRNDEAETRRIQRLIDIDSLTEQYTRAQIANARELATAQVDAIAANEAIEREVDENIRQSERRNERRLAAEQAIRAEQEERLRFEIELARLGGDYTRVEALERELELLRRIAEYGPGREGQARQDQGTINNARDEASEREQYREYARTFVDALRSGNFWEEMGERFADAAANSLENIIADLLASLGKNKGGPIGGLLNFAGSIFGGARALGGPVRAGFSYDVGENGREKFVAPVNGYIMPNMENLAAPAGGGGMSFNYAPVYNVSGYGQDIEALKRQMKQNELGFRGNVAAAVNDGYQRGKIRLQR